ncbi:MAG: DUF1214 domain-containing protein, partial [Steroidobacteraceae bacterium]
MTSSLTNPVLAQAWERYCTSLDEMRRLIEQTPRFHENPQDRAKAFHTLFEAQAMAYNFVIGPRLSHPRIHTNTTWQTDMYTLGQNGPDFLYGSMFVDGRQTYRLSGHYGDVILFLLQVHNGVPGQKDMKMIGDHDLSTFKRDANGRFELILSAKEYQGNWVPLDPDCRLQFILTRRVLKDPHDDPGEFLIERISKISDDYYDDEEFDEQAVARRAELAIDFLRFACERWTIGLYDMFLRNAGGQKNTMTLLAGNATGQVAASVSNYAMAIFSLADDEAAIIELAKPPDGIYWSYQLGDVWSRSLNFTSRQTSLNMNQIAVDPDGGVRVILCARDPGFENWLDTCGHRDGIAILRNFVAKS